MPDQTAPLARLREPFPPNVIGKLPKGGVNLDFVGHAAVTDRLLTIDPEWSWEPFALDEHGLPAVDKSGNLWIRLTVCGVTRIGVGDGKSAKETIGDAIRNAAMRFGVALDLWTKDELESAAGIGSNTKPARAAKSQPAPESPKSQPAADKPERPAGLITEAQRRKMWATAKDAKLTDKVEFHQFVTDSIGHELESSNDLTIAEAARVIDALEALARLEASR